MQSGIRFLLHTFAALALVVLSTSHATAQTVPVDFSLWPTDLKINGTVIGCTGPEISPRISDLLNSSSDETTVVLLLDDNANADGFELDDAKADIASFEKEDFDDLKPILAALDKASGVLLVSSKNIAPSEQKLLSAIQPSIQNIIDGGGVLAGVGPVVSHFGKHCATTNKELIDGMHFAPDTIILHDYQSSRRDDLNNFLANKPLSVGIGIAESTAFVLRGRKIRTYGKGKNTFVIAGNRNQRHRVQELSEASRRRRTNPYQTMVDLTAWRRDAIDRQRDPFPPTKAPTPFVEKGTLMIVGGGGMPRGLSRRMVQAAGGKKAKMVFIPCSEQDSVSSNSGMVRLWKQMGVASATVLHTKDRNKANSDEEFLAPLKEATGIWFGGGRQWNLADSYYGTQAHQLMKDVLARGGVIGGSSAGASIQADYLLRGNPLGNFDMMAAGYERGLGFLQGVAIDQHFSQRRRHKDLAKVIDRLPQLLGIGLDEGTAIVVTGSDAEVVGKGKAFFFDRREPVADDADGFIGLSAGSHFDLNKRQVTEESTEE